jgi:copper chaperone CopZ
MNLSYQINGMRCQKCVDKISIALAEAKIQGTVSLSPPLVRLEKPTAEQMIIAALQSAGGYSIDREAVANRMSGVVSELTPLFVILSYLLGSVFLIAYCSSDYRFGSIMNHLMGGFFVIFSLFKMIQLSGFADAFMRYDILARKSRAYALSYPFLELLLGIGYFTKYYLPLLNSLTVILMCVGSIGVFQSLRAKQTIQCACLGSALSLPMTKVTLIENSSMGLMALIMLLSH